MDAITNSTKRLEKGLGEYHFLKMIEEKTKAPKLVIVSVGALVSFTALYVLLGPALLCNLSGFLYPAYASFKSIGVDNTDEDVQWLTYWVIYAIFNVFESFAGIILFWFPFYYSFKFGFLLWLFLPHTRGAQYLYLQIIFPAFGKASSESSESTREASRNKEGSSGTEKANVQDNGKADSKKVS